MLFCMLMVLLSLIGVIHLAGLLFLAREFRNAPAGFQDETGFHFVTEE